MLKTKKQLQQMSANEVVDYLLKHHRWHRLKAKCVSGFSENSRSTEHGQGWNTFVIAGHALYGADWYNIVKQSVCRDNPRLTLIRYNGKTLPSHLPDRWELSQDEKDYDYYCDKDKLIQLYGELDWRAFATLKEKFENLPDWAQNLITVGGFIAYFAICFAFCSSRPEKHENLKKNTAVLEQKNDTSSAPCNTADFYRFKNELQY